MARTASSAPDARSGTTKAQLLIALGFSARIALPAALRTSPWLKPLALPAPTTSRRFAFSPWGRWSIAVSKALPVTSPLPTRSATAFSSAASFTASRGSGFSLLLPPWLFTEWSRAKTTRHSVSTSAGLAAIRRVSIMAGSAPIVINKVWLLFSRSRNGLAGFFVCGAAAFGLAFVPALFAFGQRNLAFDLAALEIHARRDQGIAFLQRLALEFAQFTGMDQQFACAERRVSRIAGVFIRADVGVEQPQLAVF